MNNAIRDVVFVFFLILLLLLLGGISLKRSTGEVQSINFSRSLKQPDFNLSDIADKCEYVKLKYDASSGYINYLNILYCSKLKSVPALTYTFFALWLIFLFSMLCVITSKYFVPVLTDLSTRLKLGHELSGLTLLALGNGASDFASNLAASNADALGLVVGEVIGTGLLITTITVSCAILAAPTPIMLHDVTFVKDTLVYIVSLTAVFFMFWYGKIYIYMAVIITVLYVGYVVFSIVLNGYSKRKKKKSANADSQLDDPSLASLSEIENIPKYNRAFSLDYFMEKYKNMSKLKKIYFILTFVPCIPLNLTINTVRWNRAIAAISPITCWIPIFGAFQIVNKTITSGFPLIVIFFLAGLVCLIIILATTNDDYPPSYSIVFMMLSFVVCLCWSYIVVNEIIVLLKSLGYVLNISEVLLGATILTLGNSLPDAISAVILSRNRYGRIVMSAAYAGPIFNILFSLGISFIIKTAKAYPGPVILKVDKLFFISSGYLMFNMYTVLICFALFMKFKLRKPFSFWLIILYVSYIIIIILAEMDIIWKD